MLRSATASAVVLLGLLVTASATAAARPNGATVGDAAVREAREFWTPARMARARPVRLQLQGHLGLKGSTAGVLRRALPRRIPARAPAAGASASSSFETVPDPAATDFRQNGVIFFEYGDFLARCSGTSVNSPNLSVVLTAGHCVNEGGRHGHFSLRHWVFVPGYRFGQRPYGVFPAERLFATQGWLETGSENFDVGAAVVGRSEHGRRLGAVVGGTGIAWNLSPAQTFDVHGYPVEAPFDGETQQLCPQTPFLGHDAASYLWPGPLDLAVDCDVTGGASGGGWTIAGNVLNGVTDYGYVDGPETDFGAYFGQEVAKLYGRAASVK